VQGFTEALGDNPPEPSESAEAWVDVARFLATAWRMTIRIEASRISITLPEPPRRSLQLPKLGATVVVFGFGEILEIWDALKWHEHVRAIAKKGETALSEAIDDLRQR
jgi:DNA-binding transcriptional regulator/RsmH inhibitor MraZ